MLAFIGISVIIICMSLICVIEISKAYDKGVKDGQEDYKRTMQEEDIKAGVAHYDTITGEFKWGGK